MLFRRHTITFDAALRDLTSGDARARVAAADALGDLPEGLEGAERAQAADGLRIALSDPRFEVRRSAVLSLGEYGADAPFDALVDRLADDNGEVRQAAAIALGKLGDDRAWEPLLQALRDGPPDVRFQAASSLVELDAERAYEPLVDALRDGDALVRGSAAQALAVVGDARAAEAIAALLDDGAAETRFEAACALGRLGDARAVEPLIGWLEKDPDHAWTAVEILEGIGDARGAAPLARVARKVWVARALRIRAAGAAVLLDPALPEAGALRDLLDKGARSRRQDVRGLAEEALARLSAPQADKP